MADVQFAPPLQRLTSPPTVSPVTSTSAARCCAGPSSAQLRLLLPSLLPHCACPLRCRRSATTGSAPVMTLQDIFQPAKSEVRPVKRKKKRGKKLLTTVVLLGLTGGAGVLLPQCCADPEAARSRTLPRLRSPMCHSCGRTITSAEYSITLSAVQNGVPSNLTTKVARGLHGRRRSEHHREPGRWCVHHDAGDPHPGVGVSTGPGVRQGMESSAPSARGTEPVRHCRVHPDDRRHRRSAACATRSSRRRRRRRRSTESRSTPSPMFSIGQRFPRSRRLSSPEFPGCSTSPMPRHSPSR